MGKRMSLMLWRDGLAQPMMRLFSEIVLGTNLEHGVERDGRLLCKKTFYIYIRLFMFYNFIMLINTFYIRVNTFYNCKFCV